MEAIIGKTEPSNYTYHVCVGEASGKLLPEWPATVHLSKDKTISW
jgi:hypothetical protein